MPREKYSSIQAFIKSKPKDVRVSANSTCISSGLVFNSEKLCLPCKVNCKTSKVVRPVLCSRQLNNHDEDSDDSLAMRKQHYVQIGKAWVEHSAYHGQQNKCDDKVWERARDYNDHIEYTRQNKAAKLQEFQQQVKERVKKIEEQKLKVLAQKTMLEAELERKVARKTAYLAQGMVPHANEVMITGRSDLIVKNSEVRHPQADGLRNPYDNDTLGEIKELSRSIELESRRKRVARQKLLSRQVNSIQHKDLPGGLWRETGHVEYPPPADSRHGDDIPNSELLLNTSTREDEIDLDEEHKQGKNMVINIDQDDVGHADIRYAFAGHVDEEIKKQEAKQRALLRRLYMDMEREQVKEYKKMKKELERIALIKQEKENQRRQIELEADLANLKVNETPKTSISEERQLLLEEQKARRERESERYIKALKSLLQERLERSGVGVPPLCSCGETVWDTDPEYCANNCPFYKNPKAYERALQSLLSSCGAA